MSPQEKIMVAALAPIKPTSPAWTDERVELAKLHREQGLSASQSAAILGVTRNAVIGKWGRLGLPLRRPVSPPKPKAQRSRQAKLLHDVGFNPLPVTRKLSQMPRPERQSESKLSPDDIPRFQRRTMETIADRHCRFPYGTPGAPDFFFCGAVRVDPGRPIDKNNPPYCSKHCRDAYKPDSARKQWNDLDWRLKTNEQRSMEGFSGLAGGKGSFSAL